jgi:hypothetical protein
MSDISDDAAGQSAEHMAELHEAERREAQLAADRKERRPERERAQEKHVAELRIDAQVAAIAAAATALKRREGGDSFPKLDAAQFKELLSANNDLGACLESAGVRLVEESVEDLTGRHN